MSDMSQKSEVHSVMGSIRDKLQDVMGFEHQHAYVNEAYGDEGPEVWFGAHNLPRLVALKQRWDPKGQFGAGMPIPLSL
jgi:FAD/FMN-containing dehydrogenase